MSGDNKVWAADWRPPHAYIPGETQRHPEGLFDFIKQKIGDASYADFHKTEAWAYGVAFHKEEYFWECHEVFEEIWMACPPNSPEKLYVQAIIQKANAGLKRKMGRETAAARLDKHASELEAEARARKPVNLYDGS